MQIYAQLISKETGISLLHIGNTLKLIDEGSTVPFISRYRKEMTGSLDEVKVADIKDRYEKLQELQKRKETVLKTIEAQEKLTDELRLKIEQTWSATELEDLYLPYKPKRRTRAEIARKKGLEPLALIIRLQQERDLEMKTEKFLSDEVPTPEDALQGARDIIAEQINEDESARNAIRSLFRREAVITSKVIKGKEEEADKYKDYFDYAEPLRKCISHRLLAVRRGEAEGFLKVSIEPAAEDCVEKLDRLFIRSDNECSRQLDMAVKDAYKRLLKPSIETEFAASSKEKADEEAIRVFAGNLRQLLLASPLGQKNVLALDPGFRTGCKLVCLDAQGNLLHHDVIFPHPPVNKEAEAAAKVRRLAKAYGAQAISIGNGTASRETETFVRGLNLDIPVFVVSEQGASIYSASKVAREEFPDEDVTVRGAVSIGRRLMDPLAELVKIDPKSIGVGQYQHDVDQGLLKKALEQTVEYCVNSVGIHLNTASSYLLEYVSGLGPALAKNIVNYRAENGAFTSREELLKVPRMGAKAYEQCAGFLRIAGGKNPLDNTAVHPESYPVVEQMAKDLGYTVEDLITNAALREQINLEKYVSGKTGLPTLRDIMTELDKPGRDPRGPLKAFSFDETVHTIDDLKEGMILPGIVTNITDFGAFVDIGVHKDGLVHISQLANRYVSNPSDVVAIHQQVKVRVLQIDRQRGRIQLSMKEV